MATEKKHNKEVKYPICKQHQLINVLPQFKPIRRGRREKAVENIYVSKNGENRATISMFHQLDIGDQDLLLCVLAISLPLERGKLIHKESENPELWKKLETEGIYTKWKTLCIKTTPYEILTEMGKGTRAKDYKWLEQSLDRLVRTSIKIKTKEGIGHTNLLSYGFYEEKLQIAINPVNALVLMNDKRGYILQNRNERIELKTEVAKALYSVLVSLVAIKNSATFQIDILLEKIYICSIENENKDSRKNKRASTKEALLKINGLDRWDIEFYKNNRVKITRK